MRSADPTVRALAFTDAPLVELQLEASISAGLIHDCGQYSTRSTTTARSFFRPYNIMHTPTRSLPMNAEGCRNLSTLSAQTGRESWFSIEKTR